MMNKQIELKPCPFCGGEAKITVVKKGFKSIIECQTHYCGFMRHSFNNGDTDEHAAVRLATAWNSRANEKQSENVIELPCKVGTTLYFIYNSPYADKPDLTPRIYKTADWYFEVDKTGIVINTRDIHSFNKEYDYHLGKTVFFTQEEAEKLLQKMKGGE